MSLSKVIRPRSPNPGLPRREGVTLEWWFNTKLHLNYPHKLDLTKSLILNCGNAGTKTCLIGFGRQCDKDCQRFNIPTVQCCLQSPAPFITPPSLLTSLKLHFWRCKRPTSPGFTSSCREDKENMRKETSARRTFGNLKKKRIQWKWPQCRLNVSMDLLNLCRSILTSFSQVLAGRAFTFKIKLMLRCSVSIRPVRREKLAWVLLGLDSPELKAMCVLARVQPSSVKVSEVKKSTTRAAETC